MEEEKVAHRYFNWIYDELSKIEECTRWADQVMGELQQLKMDVRFLKALCLCLETWGYTTGNETMKRLRSMISPLKVIWLEEHEAFSTLKRLAETWPIDIQDFHSAKFDLEEKIQQSKQHVEIWCVKLMHSSMQCKTSMFLEVLLIVRDLQKNLDDFSSFRAANFVSLKKQIDILKSKIVFLDVSSKNVERCPYTKEIPQFMNFIGDFASSAVCLTCLYWAEDSNEEIAAEMNIAIFDLSQKIMPSAYDITPLYIGFLKSFNLQQCHDSFLLGEAVESLVDFFFQHLATTLMDDFQILRDRLIFLFAFLADPPCENALKEDIIRSQIYALLREDRYLLLSFDEMTNDFADKKMLLSDCMTKIDIANDMIRQLDCGFSDYWIRLEVEKMEHIYFVLVQRELSLIEKYARWAYPVLGQLRLYKMELRFLRLFFLCFTTWDDTDEEIKVRLNSMITSLQGIWGKNEEKGLLAHHFHEICNGSITDWHPLASELEGKIQLSKLEIEAWRVNMFRWSFRCKPSTTYKILKFLDSILDNLNGLVDYKAGKIVPFKKQIEILKEKLAFLKNFLRLTTNCAYSKELGEFKMFVQVYANDAACLTFLYWTKDANDEIACATNSILSQMLLKIKPATTDIARLYFETLKAIYVQRSDSLMFGQTALSFVDYFLEDLVTPLKDSFHFLRDDILFLLTFLNDPPNVNAKVLICSQIDVLFWEGVYCLLPFDDTGGDFSRKKVLLNDFMMKIETINTNVRQNCCEFPDLSVYHFPMVISPRFLDFLIQNLRNLKERMVVDPKYVPFGNYNIIKIEEELVSFCPFFNHIFDLQSEENETWLEVVNLLHLIEHVISSCISSRFVFDHPIWYHMAYLSYVLQQIKVVKTKLEKIKENAMFNVTCLHHSTGFITTPTKQVGPSETNEIFVGFEDEVEKIINNLTRGSMSLDIVSIVGMGGLGKTTLAKKVYGSSLVKCNFDVFAFCFVSQDHTTRRLLVDILGDIEAVDKEITHMSEDDLAHQLWQCLSHRKYLIVLDDIWNVSAWNKVKRSLPDNENGSRIIFTTRSRDVADKCKIDCIPHQLRFLSEVESWDLLQRKIFHNGISTPYLFEVGRRIANNCKGLPLAVVLIAGLLARTEKSIRWWSEVAENVVSYLSDEGCMKILELSYKHLPEILKPCLLYLGAFPEDMLIRVKQVILLWIAEGFVQESKTNAIEDVAKEYFHDLVDRSFIIVGARSSNGEINTFRVHDLIRDLCRTKCRDGNFFQLNHGSASSNSLKPSIDNHYRVSMQKQSDVDIVAKSSLSYARSLLLFFEHPDNGIRDFALRKFGLAHVFDSEFQLHKHDMEELSSLVHLRYINVGLRSKSIPSSISNLWNIGSFILTSRNAIKLPETFWRMKSLRHVKVSECILQFSDGYEHEAYPTLDKVVSFSKPVLSTEKGVQQLLQRLPAVKKLSAFLENSFDNDEELIETLDIQRNLDSLNLTHMGKRSPCWINFPSTLKKLTLVGFELPWTAISVIADLQCLQVLKLRYCYFPEPRLEMEDVVFQNLKFFELYDQELVEWNALTESLPCLEQLVIECSELEELPPCFGEISTLKRIVVRYSPELESSALWIQEEQIELGNEVDVSIFNGYDLYNSNSQL